MKKRILSLFLFNLAMVFGDFVIASRRFLNLNTLNFNQTPFRIGLSWTLCTLWLGIYAYFNMYFVKKLMDEINHNEALRVRNPEIDNVSEALDKLKQSKRNNPKLANSIDAVIESLLSFQNKKDIMSQLLANNGQEIKNWIFIRDFNEGTEREMLAFVRQVIDSGIVFDDPNEEVGSKRHNEAQTQIAEYNQGICKLLDKYDEFLQVVKQVLEKRLRKKGIVATDTLDITIQSVKKVYGIAEYGEIPLEAVTIRYDEAIRGGKK